MGSQLHEDSFNHFHQFLKRWDDWLSVDNLWLSKRDFEAKSNTFARFSVGSVDKKFGTPA